MTKPHEQTATEALTAAGELPEAAGRQPEREDNMSTVEAMARAELVEQIDDITAQYEVVAAVLKRVLDTLGIHGGFTEDKLIELVAAIRAAGRQEPPAWQALTVQSYLLEPCTPVNPLPATLERVGQRSGPDLWAIRQRGRTLNRAGEWEWEPQPSSREDDYLERNRYASTEDALRVWTALFQAPPPRCVPRPHRGGAMSETREVVCKHDVVVALRECVECERDALASQVSTLQAEVVRLTAERERYENALCTTCATDLATEAIERAGTETP